MSQMKILSFDPASFRNLGYAFILFDSELTNKLSIQAGTLIVDNMQEPWRSCFPVYNFAKMLLLKVQPDLVILEKTSSFRGGFVSGQVSACLGSLYVSIGEYKNTDIEFVYPTHVKKVITGKGKATKTEMKRSVNQLIEKHTGQSMKLDSDHAYDAVGNIICWLTDSGYLVGENNET